MKKGLLTVLVVVVVHVSVSAQKTSDRSTDEGAMYALIDAYSLARETSDTVLLKSILTKDVDQLVSNGVWRSGIHEAMVGMQQSSGNNPGMRSLTIRKIRFLGPASGIVDAEYVIKQENGTERRMWSSFIVVRDEQHWKISAIRNMLPTGSQ